MKLKCTLWALAIAFAAVSCSEEMVNGPGTDKTDEEKGQKAYMSVYISTVEDNDPTSKADDPTNPNRGGAGWGEDGNGWLGELDGKNEAKIHDINIFLVETTEQTLTTANHLNQLNGESKPIVGHIYQPLDEPLNADQLGDEAHHNCADVTITLDEEIELDDNPKYFMVYTIVNEGTDLSSIKNLVQLRDYVHTGPMADNETNVATADRFVMSTHKMVGDQAGPSIVTLTAQNTADNPATVVVYVERLAARIDLGYPANGTLEIDENASESVKNKGTFTLTGYMVVNQWQGETNMFKQVTPTVSRYDTDITNYSNYAAGDPKKYLGDEKWQWTPPKGPAGTYNFVLSQKFTKKTGDNILQPQWDTDYKNHFDKSLNNKLGEIKSLPSGIKYDDEDNSHTYYPITYVRENTTNTSVQLNGYSTGVIFQTRFEPNENFKVGEYKDGQIKEVQSDGTYIYIVNQVPYKDVKSAAASAFDIADGDNKDILKGFMEDWDAAPNANDVTLQALQDTINKMSEANELSRLFKQYLLSQLQGVVPLTQKVSGWANRGNLTYNKFLERQPDLNNDSPAVLAEKYGIHLIKGGNSYHKFWIRHDDNNNNSRMGVMEFAIVRNNVYQLYVKGIRGFGDPLPFTPGPGDDGDDPGTPDEEDDPVTINVTVNLKDWVKRTNKDIILNQ